MFKTLKSDKRAIFTVILYLGFFAWWLFLHFNPPANGSGLPDWFAGTYGVIAILGGIWGLRVSKQYGGWRSLTGRSIQMFSIGLLLQEFGQLVYAYYAIVKSVETPYPSMGDIGFFGSVLFYIYGAILLVKLSGAGLSLKKLGNKAVALIIPAAILSASYMLFLKGYTYDSNHPLTAVLDFGYPLGQALYIAIALLAYLLSMKLLGGLMRSKILLIIIALGAQYIADFNFLFQASHETWKTAGYGDLLYMTSYLIMTLALLNMSAHTLSISVKNNDNGKQVS